MKEKFKSYKFWIALLSAAVLIVQNVGKNFGFTLSEEFASVFINSVCSLLVVLGIVEKPKHEQIEMVENKTLTSDKKTKVDLLNDEALGSADLLDNDVIKNNELLNSNVKTNKNNKDIAEYKVKDFDK